MTLELISEEDIKKRVYTKGKDAIKETNAAPTKRIFRKSFRKGLYDICKNVELRKVNSELRLLYKTHRLRDRGC